MSSIFFLCWFACFHFWLLKCLKCFNLRLVLTFYCLTMWRTNDTVKGNYKCVTGKHKWFQITCQIQETVSFWVESHDAFKLLSNQKTKWVRAQKEVKSPVLNFYCHFLEEASVGVRGFLWGGLVALCTTSPSLPHTGIWWQTRFNLPAMSSWVQLLIAGCGGVTCLVRNEFKWMGMIQSREGKDSCSSAL